MQLSTATPESFGDDLTGRSLRDIPVQLLTYDLCTAAVRRSAREINFVPHQFKTSQLVLIALENRYSFAPESSGGTGIDVKIRLPGEHFADGNGRTYVIDHFATTPDHLRTAMDAAFEFSNHMRIINGGKEIGEVFIEIDGVAVDFSSIVNTCVEANGDSCDDDDVNNARAATLIADVRSGEYQRRYSAIAAQMERRGYTGSHSYGNEPDQIRVFSLGGRWHESYPYGDITPTNVLGAIEFMQSLMAEDRPMWITIKNIEVHTGSISDEATAQVVIDQVKAGTYIKPDLTDTPACIEYQGHAYFWSESFKHRMRDATPQFRRLVHAAFTAAKLPLDGDSSTHYTMINKIEKLFEESNETVTKDAVLAATASIGALKTKKAVLDWFGDRGISVKPNSLKFWSWHNGLLYFVIQGNNKDITDTEPGFVDVAHTRTIYTEFYEAMPLSEYQRVFGGAANRRHAAKHRPQ